VQLPQFDPLGKFCHIILVSALILLSSCSEDSGWMVERSVELPDGLGTLQIRLDSNLFPTGHWVHRSDYTCGREFVWGYSHTDWPIVKDTSYITPIPDSLFHLVVRVSPCSLEKCNSALDAKAWLNSRLFFEQIERPKQSTASHGTIDTGDAHWSFWCSSQCTGLFVDLFEGYREYKGRAILFRWQRIAASPPSFEFETYCRTQLKTVSIATSQPSDQITVP
jgi:hypothetical protein